MYLVDGTLVPARNWRCKQGMYSGKHRRKGFNLHISCNLDGIFLYAGKPVAGSTHDAKAFKNSGLKTQLSLSCGGQCPGLLDFFLLGWTQR
ncbi:MAG: hypothetical protein JO100_18645 [Pseudonocardia sp.]|nr:hypothetical protein [Pseudonocardia sp.]